MLIDRIKDSISCKVYAETQCGIKLRGSEAGGWRGRGLFSDDDNGALSITGDGRKWYDHVQSTGGSVIDLCMAFRGCTLNDALTELCGLAGIDRKEIPAEYKHNEDNSKILQGHIDRWHAALTDDVRGYLHSRGLTDEEIDKYKIGITDASAGLYYSKEREGTFFAGRICFPLFHNGRVVGFSTRTNPYAPQENYGGKDAPKYMHCKEIRGKTRVVPWGLQTHNPDGEAPLIITEGIFDAMHYARIGYPVLAIHGGNLRRDDISHIAAYGGNAYIVMDSDKAGREFSAKISKRLIDARVRCKVATVPAEWRGELIKDALKDNKADISDFYSAVEAAGDSGAEALQDILRRKSYGADPTHFGETKDEKKQREKKELEELRAANKREHEERKQRHKMEAEAARAAHKQEELRLKAVLKGIALPDTETEPVNAETPIGSTVADIEIDNAQITEPEVSEEDRAQGTAVDAIAYYAHSIFAMQTSIFQRGNRPLKNLTTCKRDAEEFLREVGRWLGPAKYENIKNEIYQEMMAGLKIKCAAIIRDEAEMQRLIMEWLQPTVLKGASAPNDGEVVSWVRDKHNLTYIVNRDAYYEYDGGAWVKKSDDEVSGIVSGELGVFGNGKNHKTAQSLLKTRVLKRVELNKKPLMIFANGTLELETGIFRKSRAEDWSTVRVPYEYDPQAKCPEWDRFIDTVMQGDADLKTLLQDAAGYVLFPDCRHRKAFIFQGGGKNGKSVFLHFLSKLIGGGRPTVSTLGISAFAEKFERVALADSWLNISSEAVGGLNSGAGVEAFKCCISGDVDVLTACEKFKQSFEFHPRAKLFIAMNKMTKIGTNDVSELYRYIMVPWRVTFKTREEIRTELKLTAEQAANWQDTPTLRLADPDLYKKLDAELPGIFNWMLKGYRQLMQRGDFVIPAAHGELLTDYLNDTEPVRMFVDDLLHQVNLKQRHTRSDIIDRLIDWWRAHSVRGQVPNGKAFWPMFRAALEDGEVEFAEGKDNDRYFVFSTRGKFEPVDTGSLTDAPQETEPRPMQDQEPTQGNIISISEYIAGNMTVNDGIASAEPDLWGYDADQAALDAYDD